MHPSLGLYLISIFPMGKFHPFLWGAFSSDRMAPRAAGATWWWREIRAWEPGWFDSGKNCFITHTRTHTHLQHLVNDISLPVDFVRRFREKLYNCKPAIFLGITPAQSSVTPHVYLPVVRRQTQVGLRADAFPACLDCNHISNQKAQVKSPQCEQESQQ